MSSRTPASITVGDSRTMVVVDQLSRTQLVMYAGASGDYNPVHTDDVFAREQAGLPGVFAHGMLTMGMTGRLFTDWIGDGRLTSYSARFQAQVWPGDTLTASAEAAAVEDGSITFTVRTTNQRGEVVLTGTAEAAVP